MNSLSVPVIDYRRRRVSLQWHTLSGTWTAFDEPPAIVHGVCFIRASGPNFCLYAENGRLHFQVDARIFPLTYLEPRISCARTLFSVGMRRRFRLESALGDVLYSTSYWAPHSSDFFVWLSSAEQQAEWHEHTARRWTEGLNPAALRAEVNPSAQQ